MKIERKNDLVVWTTQPSGSGSLEGASAPPSHEPIGDVLLRAADPRGPAGLLERCIADLPAASDSDPAADVAQRDSSLRVSDKTAARDAVLARAARLEGVLASRLAALGILEGDVAQGRVPLEWNIEQLGGVAFDKGCYVGQELVARSHFKGLLRKRMFPVILTAFDEDGDRVAGSA